MFATDDDIVTILPTIFDHGHSTWVDELALAEADVVRKIQVEWYNKKYSPGNFDVTLLTETQWKQATIYRALGWYILPKLSQWRVDGDSFQGQITFYTNRFDEEMQDQFAVGLEYDYNEDGTVDETEKTEFGEARLWR